MKSKILFEILSNIIHGKSNDTMYYHISSDDFKSVSSFIVLKYLSMCEDKNVIRYITEKLPYLEKLELKYLYGLLMKDIPRQKSGFIRWIRSN